MCEGYESPQKEEITNKKPVEKEKRFKEENPLSAPTQKNSNFYIEFELLNLPISDSHCIHQIGTKNRAKEFIQYI